MEGKCAIEEYRIVFLMRNPFAGLTGARIDWWGVAASTIAGLYKLWQCWAGQSDFL